MIDLSLLNSIPRPDGWGEFEVANFGFVFTQLSGTRTRVQVYLAGLQISLVESGGVPTPPDGPAGFAPHLQYLRTGWLPISTVPRDTREYIDLWCDGEPIRAATWSVLLDTWVTERCHDDDGGCYELPVLNDITHWRPLPCSPSST